MRQALIATCAFVLLLPCGGVAGALRTAGDQTQSHRDEPLATVGEHVITRRELEVYVQVFCVPDEVRDNMDELPPKEREEFYSYQRSEALPELIERHLMLAGARKSYPNRAALDKALKAIVQKHVRETMERLGGPMRLHEWLRARGLRREEWKGLVADTVLLQDYEEWKINSRVHVSPEEITGYYEEHKEEFRRPSRVIYRAIVVDPAGCSTPEEERARAETILESIARGADFAEAAEEHSLDRDSTEGGLREVEAPLDEPDWLPPVCRGLESGQVSGVQRTGAGCVIAKLEQVVPSHVPPFEQAQGEIERALRERKAAELRSKLILQLHKAVPVQCTPAGEELMRRARAG